MRKHNSIFWKIPNGYAIYGGMVAQCGLIAKLKDNNKKQ